MGTTSPFLVSVTIWTRITSSIDGLCPSAPIAALTLDISVVIRAPYVDQAVISPSGLFIVIGDICREIGRNPVAPHDDAIFPVLVAFHRKQDRPVVRPVGRPRFKKAVHKEGHPARIVKASFRKPVVEPDCKAVQGFPDFLGQQTGREPYRGIVVTARTLRV